MDCNHKSSDFGALPFLERLAYVRDLVSSEQENKLSELKKIFGLEVDVQIKYEIRKGINELESLLCDNNLSNKELTDSQLQEMLCSLQHNSVRQACHYVVRHNLQHFLPELMSLKVILDIPFLKISILKLLAFDASQRASEITAFLQDDDPRVLATALECLENIANPDVQMQVLEFILHDDNRVRATAMKTLYKLGEEKGLSLLDEMSHAENSAYRDSAAFALASLNSDKAIPSLRFLLFDTVESVRAKAYGGLLQLANKGSAQALDVINDAGFQVLPSDNVSAPNVTDSAALHSNVKEFRLQALATLDQKPPEIALRSILTRLTLERDIDVRVAGIGCLTKISGYAALKQELLLPYLTSDSDLVRVAALEVMIGVIPATEKSFFISFLDDFSPKVIACALLGLMDGNYNSYIEYGLRRLFNIDAEEALLRGVYCVGILQNEKYLDFVERILYCFYPKVRERGLELLSSWVCFSSKAHDILSAYHRKVKSQQHSIDDCISDLDRPWY